MQDLESIVIRCSDWHEIVAAVNRAKLALPVEIRKRLVTIFSSYLARFGVEGCYERLNTRSVAQIFAEFQPEDLPEIASGEVDGVRYRLYGTPKADPLADSPTGGTP